MPRRERSRRQQMAIFAALRARQNKSRVGMRARRLSPGEESTIYDLIRKGDQSARKHLITANSMLVSKLAGKFTNRGLDYKDLVQEGHIGLMKAAETFNPKKGTKFSTHATNWIKQHIGRAIEESSGHIRIPSGQQWILNKARKIGQQFYQRVGREPGIEELAYMMKMKPNALRTSLGLKFKVKSTNTPIGKDGEKNITLEDIVPDRSQESPLDRLVRQETEHDKSYLLHKRLQNLTPVERHVLVRKQSEKGTAIGKDLKLSRARISQIEKQALTKLKSPQNKISLYSRLKNFVKKYKG